LKILFICSRNQWRSPTAEAIYSRVDGLSVRSAGTAKSGKRRVKAVDLNWADIIFVMEDRHKTRLRQDFRSEVSNIDVRVLDVPYDYKYMDPDLIEILKAKLDPVLIT